MSTLKALANEGRGDPVSKQAAGKGELEYIFDATKRQSNNHLRRPWEHRPHGAVYGPNLQARQPGKHTRALRDLAKHVWPVLSGRKYSAMETM
ncbi:hypothetical protein N7453_005419 [Penicillium expansum]|nr:hypothetical protein N7453_005419 [Penicillium expansum]